MFRCHPLPFTHVVVDRDYRTTVMVLMLHCGIFAALLGCSPGGQSQGEFMFLHQWARKDLERGNLNALRELSQRWNDPSPARLQRLSKRGFLKRREGDK